jgi:hypothetical protein
MTRSYAEEIGPHGYAGNASSAVRPVKRCLTPERPEPLGGTRSERRRERMREE